MAHKYDSFDTAYAAFVEQFLYVKTNIPLITQRAYDALDGYSDPVDAAHFFQCAMGLLELCNLIDEFLESHHSAYDRSSLYESIFWGSWTNIPSEQFLDFVLNAMLTATPEQFTKFVGIIDAYRVALWDSPFNVDFYAALARGFKVW